MKKLFWLCLALAVVVNTASAKAADLTGVWTGSMSTPDGNSFDLTYTLKQDGTKLTGTVQGPGGEPLQIANGKIDGDKFSFDIDFNGMTIHHDCVVDGDQIKLTSKASSGDFPGMSMTLKRAGAPKPAAPPSIQANALASFGTFFPVPAR